MINLVNFYMSTKAMNQEQVQMIVTKDSPQILASTTTNPINETTNKNNKKTERANWSNRIVYLLSIIGFVVDLGRRFSE